ncbi:MAG: molybdenum cofactor guanylyltransferase MobA [Limnohabitans sp.]|nr:molybdenum cofactor guanylyltransferase MobA [Limnohabitans sp.]
MSQAISSQDITAVILAGGRGARMGGVDKGLQNFKGMPLTLNALIRLSGQVANVMINANRNLSAYESFGADVWPDSITDFAGPLAGFLTGLERCETPFLLTAPCDTPFFPLDLAARLSQALTHHDAEIAMAGAPEKNKDGVIQVRAQPVFCLMGIELLESLVRFTHGGGRKIDAWTAQHKTVLVPFDQASDDPLAFANANTMPELIALEN